MSPKLRSRPNHGTIVAYLALFVALGTGTAYAANEWNGDNIVDESLTGADIRGKDSPFVDGTLSGFDIKDGSIRGSDIAGDSISNKELASKSVGASELASDSVSTKNVQDFSLNGGLDLRPGTIYGANLAENSVQTQHISDFHLTNNDVGVLFARVNANGTVARSSGGVTVAKAGRGHYEVRFPIPPGSGVHINDCSHVATGVDRGSTIGVSANRDPIDVFISDQNGNFIDRAFHLVVVC